MTPRPLAGLIVFAAMVVAARAQVVAFPNFTDTTGLQLNSAEVTAGNTILLAANQQNRSGSFFTTTQWDVTDFSAFFQFRISSPGGQSDGTSAGADGLALVMQRVGATALGGNGEALGYGQRGGSAAIGTSVVVEFDTFANSWDPNTNHIGLNLNGSLTSLVTTNVADAFDSGLIWSVWVDYNGTALEVRASNNGVRPVSATLSQALDIASTIGGSTAFIGFTGSTGSAYGTHEIVAFAFSTTFVEGGLTMIPEPSTYALLALGLGLVGAAVWRRRC